MNTTLKTIRVHGALAKLLKRRTFKAAVRSPQEAVAFLLANFPEIEAYMRPRFFHIRAGGREIYQEDIDSPTGVYEEICITPAICGAGGSGVGSIIGGAFLIAAAIFVPFAAPVLLPLGIGLALTGVAQVLTPVPSDRPESTDSGRRDSYNFSGLQQTSREGIPVPLVYGEIMTGSVVLSVDVGEDEEELEEQFDAGAGNPNPDQNPVPDPDSGTGSGLANVQQTSGWTHCRFRIKSGSINCSWEQSYHTNPTGGIQTTNFVQDNPGNWLMFNEPNNILSVVREGQTYYWYRDLWTPTVITEYPPTNNSSYSLDPVVEANNPLSEFWTGKIEYIVLSGNFSWVFKMGVMPRGIGRPNPPWESAPTVASNVGSPSTGSPGGGQYWTGYALERASYSVPGLEGSMTVAGFEYELWIPDVINAGGATPPYIMENGQRTRWRNNGEGGTWMSVGETWNGGTSGGGLETAPWLR